MTAIRGTAYSYDDSLSSRIQSLDDRIQKMWNAGQMDQDQLHQIYRQAKIDELYHSNKIEGSTLTYGETIEVVEEGGLVRGKPLRHQTEARNLSNALDFTHDRALAQDRPVTQSDLRQIHARILTNLQEDAGEYRRTKNYILGSVHETPDPFLVPQLMTDLSDYVNAATSSRVNCGDLPILCAAAAHTWLVHIHPFTDGNGRTARALMNLVLMRLGYPPCIVTEDDRDRYIDSMDLSRDEGDLTQFIELACENIEEHLDNRDWLASLKARLDEYDVHESRTEFKTWYDNMTYLKTRCKHVVENLNALQSSSAWHWKFAEYDPLDITKYVKLRDGEGAKKTWFFGFEINSRSRRSRYVFFFASPKGSLTGKTPVALVVSKNTSSGYQSLYNLSRKGIDVPDIMQIGFDLETRKFLTVGKAGLRERNPVSLVQQFVEQVVEGDFGG